MDVTCFKNLRPKTAASAATRLKSLPNQKSDQKLNLNISPTPPTILI
jgi:hypothetical protein